MTDIATRSTLARPFVYALSQMMKDFSVEKQEATQSALARLAAVGARPKAVSESLRPGSAPDALAEAICANALVDRLTHPELAQIILSLATCKALPCLPSICSMSRARLDAAQGIQEVVAYLPNPIDASWTPSRGA
jgi:F0F1-type ATP synthase delta subunit